MNVFEHPRRIVITALLAVLIGPIAAHAQWWNRIGLQGVAISAMARSGTTLLASGPQAIYSSTDDGATWNQLVGMGGFRHIATGDNGLIVAVTTSLFAISTDGGVTWSVLRDDALRDSLGVIWTEVVIPATDEIYLGTTTDVLRSSDRGASWESRNTGLPEGSPHVGALAVTRDNGLIAATQGILGGNIYQTASGAPEWFPIYVRPQGLIGEANTVLETAQGSVVASIPELGVIRSTDEGATWTLGSIELVNRDVVRSLIGNGTELFAVSAQGRLFVSITDGVNWQLAIPWGLHPSGVQSLLPLGPNRLLAGTGSGIYELTGPSGADDVVDDAGLTLAPVPSYDGALTLRRESASTAARFDVFDCLGRIVRSGELAPGVAQARIEGLPNGSYVLRLVGDGIITTKNAMVTR